MGKTIHKRTLIDSRS